MSEFVRKVMMGYKEVPGGYENQECTHVILTKQEYADQIKEVNQARKEAQSTKYNANREIQEMRREAQAKIVAGEAAAAKTIADLEAALAAEQEESALQRGLNANLLRIARERANADRRLKPKKQHTGYPTVVPSTPSAIYSAIIFLQRRLYVSSHFQSAKTSLRAQKRTLFSLRSIWHLFFSGMAARKHRDKKRPYRY